jgi:hypothetical protein
MQMDDILLQEAIERYLNHEMSEQERAYFESLRTSTPEIDQLVVEHAMFQHEMDFYASRRRSRESFTMVPNNLPVAESFNYFIATNG